MEIFAATWIAYAGLYLCRKNLSVLMPALSRDLSFSADLLAQIVFLYSAAYSFGQFTMGLAADRFGARRVVIAGMTVSAAANFAMAFTAHPLLWLVLQGVNGLAQACGWPSLIKIVAAQFTAAERGRALAWWCTSYVFGAFLATLFATLAMTGPLWAALGWQRGAIFPAVVLLALAAAFALRRTGDSAVETPAVSKSVDGLRQVAFDGAIQTIAVSYFFIKLTRYAFLFWLPLYMVERLGYSQAQAGYASSAFELAGFAGVLAAGYLSDRLFASRRFPVGALMLAGLAAACWAHPALAAQGWAGNLMGISLIGALVFGPDTLMGGAATQDLAHREFAATAAGFVNSVGSMGQLASPLFVAQIVKHWGWDALFCSFVVMAAAGSLTLATRWSRPRPHAQAEPLRA